MHSIDKRTHSFGKSLIRDRAGNYRWHLDVLAPVKNELNEVETWIATFTDIHDLIVDGGSLHTPERSMPE